jgi:hypothetical protein
MWPRLPLKPSYTAAEVEAAQPDRWAIFNHERMFRLTSFPSALDCRSVQARATRQGPLPVRYGRIAAAEVLRLDSFGVAQYVTLHSVCSFGHDCCLGPKSHNLWLGVPCSGSQPPLTPASRLRSCLH